MQFMDLTSILIHTYKVKRKQRKGNSLVVQWLGLCAFTAGALGLIPGRRTKIPQAAQPKKKKRNFNSNCMFNELNFYCPIFR